MIIPRLTLFETPDISEGDACKLARHWSLFGSLAVTASANQIAIVSKIIRDLGDIDIQVWVKNLSPDAALELLNQGAMQIVIAPEQIDDMLSTIGANRLSTLVSNLEPNQVKQIASQGTKLLFSAGCYLDSVLEFGLTNPIAFLNPPGDQPVPLADSPEPESDQESQPDDMLASKVTECDRAGIKTMLDVNLLIQRPQLMSKIVSTLVRSDRDDKLIPTVIVDALGTALGLAYSNSASIAYALETRNGTYWSRSRNQLWEKGATSGATQRLIRIDTDCDRDCLRFTVDQSAPGFCHEQTYTCFGKQRTIETVIHRLQERIQGDDTKSFTYKLANDSGMLKTKLLEEAQELSDATDADEITWEAADVLYFTLVKMVNNGVSLDRVYAELARRMNRVVRRKNKLEQE